jgi:hypothetical protein
MVPWNLLEKGKYPAVRSPEAAGFDRCHRDYLSERSKGVIINLERLGPSG